MNDRADDRRRCAGCGGVNAAIAAKCVHCGASLIAGQAPRMRRTAVECPDCGTDCEFEELHAVEVDRCRGCDGVWFDRGEVESFTKQVAESAEAPIMGSDPGDGAGRPSTGVKPTRYRNCPCCRRTMTRRDYRGVTGIVIDSCVAHGAWLDRDAMRKCVEVFATRSLDDIEDLSVAKAVQRKMDGIEFMKRSVDLEREKLAMRRNAAQWARFLLSLF